MKTLFSRETHKVAELQELLRLKNNELEDFKAEVARDNLELHKLLAAKEAMLEHDKKNYELELTIKYHNDTEKVRREHSEKLFNFINAHIKHVKEK